MNLDELQSVQSRERQTDSLQQLRASFYEDAGRFIRQLREEREHVASRADDPFDSPDVQRLSNEIKTAEQTVEAIYERRIGKLVKQASLEAAGMTADVEGLTTEERETFDRLVSTIEENREHVLNEVLANNRDESGGTTTDAGESVPDPIQDESESEQSVPPSETTEPTRSTGETRPSEPEINTTGSMNSTDSDDSIDSPKIDSPQRTDDASRNISVADMMGDGGEARAQGSNQPDQPNQSNQSEQPDQPVQPVPPDVSLDADVQNVAVYERSEASPEQPTANTDDGGDTGGSDVGNSSSRNNSNGNSGGNSHPQVDRVMVKITRDVGKILCVDEREYDLSENDVVTLPETNVGPLLEHNAAERLD